MGDVARAGSPGSKLVDLAMGILSKIGLCSCERLIRVVHLSVICTPFVRKEPRLHPSTTCKGLNWVVVPVSVGRCWIFGYLTLEMQCVTISPYIESLGEVGTSKKTGRFLSLVQGVLLRSCRKFDRNSGPHFRFRTFGNGRSGMVWT